MKKTLDLIVIDKNVLEENLKKVGSESIRVTVRAEVGCARVNDTMPLIKAAELEIIEKHKKILQLREEITALAKELNIDADKIVQTYFEEEEGAE